MAKNGETPSTLIVARIEELGGWRGEMLVVGAVTLYESSAKR